MPRRSPASWAESHNARALGETAHGFLPTVTPSADTQRAIHAIWRIESARVIAGVARMVRDVGLAEDLAQDALVAALEAWPVGGVPDNPGAWLMTTAKRRALDAIARDKRLARKHAEIARLLEASRDLARTAAEDALDDDVGDDLLRLVFVACHPLLAPDARVALTLRLVAGLTTEEIARAFLVPEPTIAQRIVRAKRALAEAGVAFEVPRGPDMQARLASVLEVVYLVFNEGYAATSGGDWIRPALCEDALRLGRVLSALAPAEGEVHGLVALMEIQASRFSARTGPDGAPVLLLDQNRALWDPLLIQRGFSALARAWALGTPPGVYVLQAEIAACHARARTASDTEWTRIAALYDTLAGVAPSPVIEINREVAYAMAFGPAAGLSIVDAVATEPALAKYHLLPSVRADLLARLGRLDEARAEAERAAALAKNDRERAMLRARAAMWAKGER